MPRIHGNTPNSIQRLTEVDNLVISHKYNGKKVLPAGEYKINVYDTHLIALTCSNEGDNTNQAVNIVDDLGNILLECNRVKGRCFRSMLNIHNQSVFKLGYVRKRLCKWKTEYEICTANQNLLFLLNFDSNTSEFGINITNCDGTHVIATVMLLERLDDKLYLILTCLWKCHRYTEIELDEIKTYGEVQVCERNGRVHTNGNNFNFSGCGSCHCCSEKGLTTFVSSDIELTKTATFYTTVYAAKNTFAEVLTSTSKGQNESQSWCRCQCSSQPLDQSTGSHTYTTVELKQLMQEELREMSEQLKIQKNLTSAWIRAGRSADDRRITSVGMGYVAIGIIAMPFCLVVVSDCRRLK